MPIDRRHRLSDVERARAIRLYFRYDGDIRRTRRAWRRHENTAAPTPRALRSLVDRFLQRGTAQDLPRSGKIATAIVPENIDAVRASVTADPSLSTRKRAKRLGLSRSSTVRILRAELSMRPYKLQIAHTLLPVDLASRLLYSRTILRLAEEHADFTERLIMTDEAHFHLSGDVFNRQNVRFWGTVNPRIIRAKDPHASRLTVWCGMSVAGVIGPYFFEDERGRAVSVTGERYRKMLSEYVLPMLRTDARFRAVQDWWWQQDGATAHTARDTMRLLAVYFGEHRLVSRASPRRAVAAAVATHVPWPARSPDLSAADFFLWGYLKDRVYDIANPAGVVPPPLVSPRDLQQLRANIVREVEHLNAFANAPLRRAVMRAVLFRANECVRQEGRHLSNVLFK